MPAGMTKLEVYNLAIDIIKDTALQSTDQSGATARWLNRNYRQTVLRCLRQYPWNFAKEQVSLRIDREVLDFFQADGPGWQERINAALRKVAGK